MATNKDALDTFQWLYRAYIQGNNCSVANAYADVVRNALQTQAELIDTLDEAKHMLERDFIDPDKLCVIEKCEEALARTVYLGL